MNISASHYISNTYNNPHFAFFTCGKISFLAETSKYFSKKIHKHIIIYKIARKATRKSSPGHTDLRPVRLANSHHQLPLLDKRGLGGVDAPEYSHRHSGINAPALRAPPLILEGELIISTLFSSNLR